MYFCVTDGTVFILDMQVNVGNRISSSYTLSLENSPIVWVFAAGIDKEIYITFFINTYKFIIAI